MRVEVGIPLRGDGRVLGAHGGRAGHRLVNVNHEVVQVVIVDLLDELVPTALVRATPARFGRGRRRQSAHCPDNRPGETASRNCCRQPPYQQKSFRAQWFGLLGVRSKSNPQASFNPGHARTVCDRIIRHPNKNFRQRQSTNRSLRNDRTGFTATGWLGARPVGIQLSLPTPDEHRSLKWLSWHDGSKPVIPPDGQTAELAMPPGRALIPVYCGSKRSFPEKRIHRGSTGACAPVKPRKDALNPA